MIANLLNLITKLLLLIVEWTAEWIEHSLGKGPVKLNEKLLKLAGKTNYHAGSFVFALK